MSLKLEALFRTSCSSHASASLDSGIPRATTAAAGIVSVSPAGETKRRIAKVFDKKEVSISTYDTAWVAMAPSPFSSEEPCFPDCLTWLLENQCGDGSWARPHHHSLLKKVVLSSTLACILALNKWGLGHDQIKRGLHFLESNFASATDNVQISPMGFNIIFPTMLDEARSLSLDLRLDPTQLNHVMNKKDLELKRCSSDEVYLAYIAEGMGNKSQDWESVVMKYQRKNGSLFNSPSITAAAYTALRNSACLSYLSVALTKFGNAVPAVYPLDLYSQLCTVDNLEKLGISRYVSTEIQDVLDETYRCWVKGDEEIFMDESTCALAFRILRMNGYDVTSDSITKFLDQRFSSSVQGCMVDMNTTLDLYKASEVMLHPEESDLEKQYLRLKCLLEQELSSGIIQSCQLGRNINAEVKQALDYPFYAILERMSTRKNIELYNVDTIRILKTSYFTNSGDKDFLNLAVEDYNWCQAIHREEFREFNRWYEDNRLDELEFARHKSVYCYFTAAANLFAPELSDARMCWAKNALMISIIDDLYDVRGTLEESRNLVHVVELWDVDVCTECCSQNVEIIFSALKSTICEFGNKGSQLQGRNITNHIIALWLDVLHAMMQETEWSKNKIVPTFDEYMTCSYVSFGLGPIVLPALYFVGPKLSEEMVNHAEYHSLFKMMSTFGRLLNDIRVDERELNDGKPTGLPLYITKMGGEITTEDAIREIRSEIIDPQRRQLLRLVLDNTTVLPKPCKELFLNMCSVLFLFYSKDDGFWAQELIQVVDQIIHQPILLNSFQQPNRTPLY